MARPSGEFVDTSGEGAEERRRAAAPAQAFKAGAPRKVEPAVDEADVDVVERVTVRMPQELFDELIAGMAREFGIRARAARRTRIRTGLKAYLWPRSVLGSLRWVGCQRMRPVDLLHQHWQT